MSSSECSLEHNSKKYIYDPINSIVHIHMMVACIERQKAKENDCEQ
jgi:hypothetical protein